MSQIHGLTPGALIVADVSLVFAKVCKLVETDLFILYDYAFVLPKLENVVVLSTRLDKNSTIAYGLCRLGTGYVRLMSETLVSVKSTRVEL